MSNVENISSDLVTPLDVLESVQADIMSIKDLYVVAINKEGTPVIWASGNLNAMAFASLALHSKTLDFLNDRLAK